MDLAEILRTLGTTNRNVGGGGMMGLMQPTPVSMAQEAKARQAAQEAYWKEVHRVPPAQPGPMTLDRAGRDAIASGELYRVPPHTPFDKFWAQNQMLGYPTPYKPPQR